MEVYTYIQAHMCGWVEMLEVMDLIVGVTVSRSPNSLSCTHEISVAFYISIITQERSLKIVCNSMFLVYSQICAIFKHSHHLRKKPVYCLSFSPSSFIPLIVLGTQLLSVSTDFPVMGVSYHTICGLLFCDWLLSLDMVLCKVYPNCSMYIII